MAQSCPARAGSQPSCSTKIRIKTGAKTKFGSVTPDQRRGHQQPIQQAVRLQSGGQPDSKFPPSRPAPWPRPPAVSSFGRLAPQECSPPAPGPAETIGRNRRARRPPDTGRSGSAQACPDPDHAALSLWRLGRGLVAPRDNQGRVAGRGRRDKKSQRADGPDREQGEAETLEEETEHGVVREWKNPHPAGKPATLSRLRGQGSRFIARVGASYFASVKFLKGRCPIRPSSKFLT